VEHRLTTSPGLREKAAAIASAVSEGAAGAVAAAQAATHPKASSGDGFKEARLRPP
jgi:hypothetical protein